MKTRMSHPMMSESAGGSLILLALALWLAWLAFVACVSSAVLRYV